MSELKTMCGNVLMGLDTASAANLGSSLGATVGSALGSGMSIKCLVCPFKLKCLITNDGRGCIKDFFS